MNKLLIVIFVVLLITPVWADDYLDSLQEMSAKVKQNLGYATNSDGVPDSLVFSKIREGYVLFSNWMKANEIVETLVTSAGVFDYAYDSIIVIRGIFWKKGDSLNGLKEYPKDQWIDIFGRPVVLSEQEGWVAHSTYYDQTEGRIQLYPTPDKADTFLIYGLGKLQNIISDSTFVTQFPVGYRPAIIDYATAKTAAAKQMYEAAGIWWNIAVNTIRAVDTTINLREYEK
ncbi:MAG: hypothetical protein ACFFCW_01790 [Candidatus Hodarchaeota archaeon]